MNYKKTVPRKSFLHKAQFTNFKRETEGEDSYFVNGFHKDNPSKVRIFFAVGRPDRTWKAWQRRRPPSTRRRGRRWRTCQVLVVYIVHVKKAWGVHINISYRIVFYSLQGVI